MINTEIRLIVFFGAEDGEALYSQEKQDQELTLAKIMNSLLQNSDLIEESRENHEATNQIRSVSQSCLTLCNHMNRSMPGLPVYHQLPEFTPGGSVEGFLFFPNPLQHLLFVVIFMMAILTGMS